MPPRRGLSPNPPGQQQHLGPSQDSLSPPSASSAAGPPRSTSPSSGFTQFLTRPSKWFSRSASASKMPSTTAGMSSQDSSRSERGSASSGGRKHKISQPTDPRPILDKYSGFGSKSVLDLSARPQGSLELSRMQTHHNTPTGSTPSSPSNSHPRRPHDLSLGGLGDLRNISRKAWSRSADDLSKVSNPMPSSPTPSPSFPPSRAQGRQGYASPSGTPISHAKAMAAGDFSPVNPAFQERVAEYRNRSDSNASALSPSSPTSSSSILNGSTGPSGGGRHPFPSVSTTPPSSSPPRSATLPTVSISISTAPPPQGQGQSQNVNSNPSITGQGLSTEPQGQGHVHTRSHSFTPKLPSKLATPRYPPSPQRAWSHDNQNQNQSQSQGQGSQQQQFQQLDHANVNINNNAREGNYPYSYSQNQSQGQGQGQSTPTRAAFGFGFGGLSISRNQSQDASSSSAAPSPTTHRSTTLLPPPLIVEPKRPSALDLDGQPSASSTTQHDPNPNANQDQNQNQNQNQKRASQILLHSGFLNRLADLPPSFPHPASHAQLNLSSSKAWKPFKVELKGSKLFFYKPPGDRSTAIRDLFPAGLVPPGEEEEDLEVLRPGEEGEGLLDPLASALSGPSSAGGSGLAGVSAGGGAGGGGTARKKRAYWGRKTHPDLVLGTDGEVEKGSFEALTHEAVFATTFGLDEEGGVGMTDAREGVGASITTDALNAQGQPGSSLTPPPEEGEEASDVTSPSTSTTHLNAKKRKYHTFASSLLFALPLLVPRAQFETEFLRCASFLISGEPSDAKQAQLKERIAWLANEYLRYHGKPVDGEAWGEFRADVLGGVRLSAEGGLGTNLTVQASVSTQGVYCPSPVPTSGGEGQGQGQGQGPGGLTSSASMSPNLNTFSPRPEDGGSKMVSLLDALFPPVHLDLRSQEGSSSSQRPGQGSQTPRLNLNSNNHSRFPWGALQEEGMTREVLFALDPYVVARSLTLFHRSVLEMCPENVVAEFLVPPSSSEGNANEDLDEEDDVEGGEAGFKGAEAIFGTDEQPHWLTKLVLLQILAGDAGPMPGPPVSASAATATSGAGYPLPTPPLSTHSLNMSLASPSRRSEDRLLSSSTSASTPSSSTHPNNINANMHQTSRTHSRSELISTWARIGELCRTSGDELSWRAIMAALCSRPVARLDKAWKRVDPQALVAVEAWANLTATSSSTPSEESSDASSASQGQGHGQPPVTVWGGDVKVKLGELLGKASGSGSAGEASTVVEVDPVIRARKVFEEFRTSFLLCPRRAMVAEKEVGEDVRRLVGYWRNVAAEGGVTSGLAVKFQRIEQFMSLSLAAEPRRKGLFEPYFFTRISPSGATSLIPLLFPEPMPTVTLLDRSKLIRGRYDSDASDMQYLRTIEQGRSQLHLNLNMAVNKDFTKQMILGQSGTVISVYNGELMLVVQPGVGFESAPSSRPSSSVLGEGGNGNGNGATEKGLGRNPSVRVKPSSSQGLDRKTSMVRRSSLPSVSHLNRTNFVTAEPSSDPPLRVIVQAGTLNNLVSVLVHGLDSISVSVADDNGEMTLKEGMTRELVVDRAEFARVWWNVFRSFVTPYVFFELLRKIYISSQPAGSSPSISDYIEVATRRNEVLVTIKEWLTIGGGAQDVLDDAQLYHAVESFLDNQLDHAIFKSTMSEAPPVQKAWESVLETRRLVKATFRSQTMRPNISRGMHGQRSQGGRGPRTRNISTRDPPDLDRMDPEAFVDNLDGMAAAAFSNVTQEDLYITADLLEVQTSDRTAWFPSRDVSSSVEELVEIQTIYSHIQEIEPSSLISELTQDALYRLLPPGIRSCIRAYGIIRKWLISKLVAPRIGLRARQARMELLLQAIEVSRLRNTETPATAQLMDQPCVRSFVEAVTTSALLSVESRLHFRAWQGVALSRGSSCDSLASLLHRPFIQSTSSPDCLTVDMGWLLERMLEIIATPDVVEASSQEGQNLINFDKRRHLHNLISKSGSIPASRKHANSDESTRRGFERLNNIEKEVLMLQFDHRGIKDEATREAATAGVNGMSSAKKATRPFHKLVAVQIEKNRRDKSLRTRIQKEKLQEQTKNERRDDLLNKAMRPRKPISSAQKQHRNKKSMSSAFLSFMRPISSAFVSDSPQQLTLRRTASQLDFSATGKPSLVLSILDAQVAHFINNERSYVFQLDTEDGGHYLLQATTKREMTKWLDTISRVTKNAAQRRLTYLGNSPKPQIADHIHSHPIVASRDPKAVFGVELEYLLRREAAGDPVPPGTVPLIIAQCLSEVERRGLTEVGIYRIAGATTEINALKDAYNRGEFPIRPSTDIHAICDLVKTWFRLLPEPVFPPPSYHAVMDAMRQENLDDRLLRIREVVQALPQPNFDILRRVSEHLDRVTDYEEQNHMTAEALAIVFSPNLLRAPQNDFVMILNNMGLSHKLVKALITHFHTIFDETDPEGEVHSDDEQDDLDSPILEEAEEEDEENYELMHDSHDNEPSSEHPDQYTPT